MLQCGNEFAHKRPIMCHKGSFITIPMQAPQTNNAPLAEWEMEDVPVDACIAGVVQAMVKGGQPVRIANCGHGKRHGMILLEDFRLLRIHNPALYRERYGTCGVQGDITGMWYTCQLPIRHIGPHQAFHVIQEW